MQHLSEAVIHTVLDSEKETFTNHVNEVLKNDKDVGNRLPITPDQIFDSMTDGIILCKLINAAVPGKVPPISPLAINTHPSTIYHKIENLHLAIESAKAIGCTVVNTQPQFIIEKREHIVMGLIWQIIKIHIANSITLKRHPQIIVLRKEGEPDDFMQKCGYEEILIRWLNYHIKKNGGTKVIKNLGPDMADGQAYGHVLHNVTSSFDKSFWDHDKNKRAEDVIENCKRQKINTTVTPAGIVSGNPKLNTILCVEIFNEKHGLKLQEQKVVELPPEPQTDQTREIRVFKNWINSQGIEDVYVNYLIDDLKSGFILLKVIDKLRPGRVDWKNKYSNKVNSRIHIVQNCNYVLQICKDLNMKIVNVAGVDIVDGKVPLTLGIVWQLCKIYWEERVGVINQEKLIAWANDRVPQDFRIKSFKDKSIRNCQFLLHLIDSIQPNIVDFSKIKEGDSEEEQISKINYTISVARKLGAEVIALWEHVNEANGKYVSLFVAELQHVASKQGK